MSIQGELSEESMVIAGLCFCMFKRNIFIVNDLEIKEIHSLFVKYSSTYDTFIIFSLLFYRNSHLMNYNNFLEMTNDHTLPAIHSFFSKFSIIIIKNNK